MTGRNAGAGRLRDAVPRRSVPAAVAAAIGLLAGAHPGLAGPAPYEIHDAPYVEPLKAGGIRMISEQVEMISEGNDGENIHVRSTSLFEADTSRAVLVGFPVGVAGEDFSLVWNFQVRVDGQPAPTTRSAELDSIDVHGETRRHRTPVYLWPMKFAAGDTHRIVVDYDVVWSEDDLGLFQYAADFHVSQDRWWADPPPRVSLNFRLSTPLPLPCLSARPGGYAYAADSLAWTFAPGDSLGDLDVRWSPALFERFKGKFMEPYRHPGGDYFGDSEVVSLFDDEFWSYFPEIDGTLEDPDVHDEILATLGEARDARDLILARSGKPFDDPDTAERFRAEPWYTPVAGWTADRLSPIAALNVDYCDAVAAALDEGEDLDAIVAALELIRERYW